MKKLKKIKVLFVVFFAVSLFISGSIGYFIGHKNLYLNGTTPHFVNSDKNKPDNVDFSLFWDAYQKVKENYYGDINMQNYLYGAISGAYASLGDPYTAFLSPDLNKEFQDELSGDLEGVGIKMGVLDGYPTVIAPLDGSPAYKAGMKAKDKIIKVDDLETKDLSLDFVVSKIRGPSGTKVKLAFVRDGENKIREVELTRAKIDVKTVELNYKGDVAVITINEFGVDTTQEFKKFSGEITGKNINKVILDLRNNPGGLLDGSIDIAGFIFPKDTMVVSEQGKSDKVDHKSTGQGELKNVNLVVLVNGGSASAAEILAGAIKDNKRGQIIGEKTFGKGTVQILSNLKDNSSAKITVAKWLTPSGQNIDKNGIQPDIEVKDSDNPNFDTNDPILNRALLELK
ncbi:MAG: S41 family peptidase [Candidatus Berkelbacteria bacterium]|nr:S41 family peptidase [Candidatus Berkelbacteria bacterium]